MSLYATKETPVAFGRCVEIDLPIKVTAQNGSCSCGLVERRDCTGSGGIIAVVSRPRVDQHTCISSGIPLVLDCRLGKLPEAVPSELRDSLRSHERLNSEEIGPFLHVGGIHDLVLLIHHRSVWPTIACRDVTSLVRHDKSNSSCLCPSTMTGLPWTKPARP